MKRPSFQFYPSDWLRDTALRSCSTGARGLWMDMICFMHEGSPYGYLKVSDKVILPANLARMVGESLDVVQDWLSELKEAGVYDTDNGAIYSRRMIRDEELRQKRADGGKLGGNPKLKVTHEVKLEVKHKSTPSSSSSSSSSKKKDAATSVAMDFPDWMPMDTWYAFIQMRKRIGKPATDYAIKLIVEKLEKFKNSGQDVKQILEKSITSSWQDVFETKSNQADIARITVPSKNQPDPALLKLDEDRKHTGPPPPEIMAQIRNALKGKVT
jgi:hypothetical protein